MFLPTTESSCAYSVLLTAATMRETSLENACVKECCSTLCLHGLLYATAAATSPANTHRLLIIRPEGLQHFDDELRAFNVSQLPFLHYPSIILYHCHVLTDLSASIPAVCGAVPLHAALGTVSSLNCIQCRNADRQQTGCYAA